MMVSEIPLFPHSGSVPCRCSYRERVLRQATIARMPNHWCVDGCHLALPPRLWHPLNPEVGDAVRRHTQDICQLTHESMKRRRHQSHGQMVQACKRPYDFRSLSFSLDANKSVVISEFFFLIFEIEYHPETILSPHKMISTIHLLLNLF